MTGAVLDTVSFLKWPLDQVAGNPAEVTKIADELHKIGESPRLTGGDLDSASRAPSPSSHLSSQDISMIKKHEDWLKKNAPGYYPMLKALSDATSSKNFVGSRSSRHSSSGFPGAGRRPGTAQPRRAPPPPPPAPPTRPRVLVFEVGSGRHAGRRMKRSMVRW